MINNYKDKIFCFLMNIIKFKDKIFNRIKF